MADTDGDRPGRRWLSAAKWSPLTSGLSVAAAALLFWALARTGVLPPWSDTWSWLGRWWPAAVSAALLVAVLVLLRRGRQRISAEPAQHGEGRWTRVTALVTAFTALAALVFTAQSLRATRDQIDVTEQGQVADRYTKAIDQLGTPGPDHLWVRVGGIFALERIALDSPRDQRSIVEVLSAFMHTTSPRLDPGTPCPKAPADVEAAFVVVTRREIRDSADRVVIDLRDTCLSGIRAAGADLSGISFLGSDMHDADLPKAHGNLIGLSKVVLTNANLYGADLSGYLAGFVDADLTGARLADAKISPNELTRVKLVDADLTGADLRDVTLTGVDLTGAKHDSYTNTTGASHDASTKGAWW